ncbi:MAG: division/cell wall cluster transcriptional repressor MraZ [Chromatiales bacterium]|jgi:MraZ protein
MFLGVTNLNLDAKGRLQVPAKHRERLRDTCGSRLVVTINPREHCLWLYPETEWRDIERKVAKLPTLKGPNLLMQRLLLGHALEVDMDAQGRILLSGELRDYAGLEKRVAMVGEGHKFELWDESQWASKREEWLKAAGDGDSELSEELQNLVL